MFVELEQGDGSCHDSGMGGAEPEAHLMHTPLDDQLQFSWRTNYACRLYLTQKWTAYCSRLPLSQTSCGRKQWTTHLASSTWLISSLARIGG
ncbi:hypothetical protein MTO96_018440 [Rhipicephalus appendiculatus]